MATEIFNSPGARVLVVDDNANDRRTLTDWLHACGYHPHIAEDGPSATEKARVLLPDLILMAIRMSNCCGIEICRLIKSDPRTAGIPLIFLTAADHVDDRVQGLLEGAIDYLAKPVNVNEALWRVGIHLRDPRQNEKPRLLSAAMPGQISGTEQRIFRASCRLLQDDLGQAHEIANLAQAVGANKRQLNAAWRHCTGLTVLDYLREIRMAQARKMLYETNVAIEVIANDVGYDNQDHFSKAFKTRFGLSPRNFRTLCEVQGPGRSRTRWMPSNQGLIATHSKV